MAIVKRVVFANNSAKLGGKTLAQVQTGGDAATLGGKSIAQVQAGATEAIQAAQTGSVVWDTGTLAGSGVGPSKDLATLTLTPGTWLLHAEVAGSAIASDSAAFKSTLNTTLLAGSQSFSASVDCDIDQSAIFFSFCNLRPSLARLVTTATSVTGKLSAAGTFNTALSTTSPVHTVTSNNAVIIAERVGTPTGAITIG